MPRSRGVRVPTTTRLARCHRRAQARASDRRLARNVRIATRLPLARASERASAVRAQSPGYLSSSACRVTYRARRFAIRIIAGDTSGGDIAPASPKCGRGLSATPRGDQQPAASLHASGNPSESRRGRRDETRNGRYIEFRIVTLPRSESLFRAFQLEETSV